VTAASDRSYPGLARFEPRLDALPEPQRALWPRLAVLPPDAVLYGGTALALRLGHRASVDFDLFLPRSFEPGNMAREISALGSLDIVQSAPNTLSARVDGVWLSLFGVDLAAVAPPEVTSDIGLPVASLRDLGATKVQTIVDRAEARDYEDIAALLAAGIGLPDMLGSAKVVFGSRFSPLLALKALTSFEDGDLPTLPEVTRLRLVAAAASVHRIPIVGAYAATILPAASRGGTSS
jgi:hypothetical protein